VQSRIDPHYLPDYYSEKKITVTPLNFVCKRRAPLLRAVHKTRSDSPAHPKSFFVRKIAREIFATRRNTDEMRLLSLPDFQDSPPRVARARCPRVHLQLQRQAGAAAFAT
jgi:hypothetical protein